MKLYYLVNGRIPNPKAYGIQIAKMCEAFIEAGVELTLVVPRTLDSTSASMREFYRLRVDVPTVILPGPDWYDRGRAAFFLSSLVFMVSSWSYLMWQKVRGKVDVIYTVDMDTFSFSALTLTGIPCFSEMQDIKPDTFERRIFFRRAAGIITLNSEVRDYLERTFAVPRERFHIANNGVEAKWFEPLSREEARRRLSIPSDARIASFVGRFYDWKGLAVLPRACTLVPKIECRIVGGTREEFQKIPGIGVIPENMRFAGGCRNDEVPVHLAAADALIVVGTKGNESMYRYRSPMKTYEYMAARRPVVAPRVPAISSIATDAEVLFYEVDNPRSLAEKITEAVHGGPHIDALIEHAFKTALKNTWSNRAKGILSFIERRLSAPSTRGESRL